MNRARIRGRRWAFVPLLVKDYAFALLCFGFFVAALVTGEGLKSFAFLGAAAWWAVLATYWRRRALGSRRGRPQTPEALEARRQARERRRAG